MSDSGRQTVDKGDVVDSPLPAGYGPIDGGHDMADTSPTGVPVMPPAPEADGSVGPPSGEAAPPPQAPIPPPPTARPPSAPTPPPAAVGTGPAGSGAVTAGASMPDAGVPDARVPDGQPGNRTAPGQGPPRPAGPRPPAPRPPGPRPAGTRSGAQALRPGGQGAGRYGGPDAEVIEGPVRGRRRPHQEVRVVRGVRSRRLVRRIDVLTVFKVSIAFYVMGMLTLVIAGVILWNVAQALGFISDIDKSIRTLFSLKTFHLHAGTVLVYAAAIGAVLCVFGALLNTLVAAIYNLLSDVVGGVQVVVVTEAD